jgi:hypothetical protein
MTNDSRRIDMLIDVYDPSSDRQGRARPIYDESHAFGSAGIYAKH